MPKNQNTSSMSEDNGPLDKRRRGSPETKTHNDVIQLSEQGNYDDILNLLADEKNDITFFQSRTESTDSALHVAASRGHTKAVCVLLGTVVNVNDRGHRKRTPLHCSAAKGHLVVTRRLLDAGAIVDEKDADDATALEVAEKNHHADVVLLLATKGAKITENTISLAISSGNIDLLELCLQKGKSVDTIKDGHPLIVLAAKAGKWEIMSLLLTRGADATKCKEIKESALVYAAKAGESIAVRQLLTNGAKYDSGQVKQALFVAKNQKVVHEFLNVDPKLVHGEAGCLALLGAASEGRHETLGALCAAGINIDCRDSNGQTALYHAAANGRSLCVKELVTRGADLNAKNIAEKTPLHAATMSGHEICVRILNDAGANPTETKISRKTPLDVAKKETIRKILSSPAEKQELQHKKE